MRGNYRRNIANEINMLGCIIFVTRNICDEARCRSWRVSLNILLE